jgi:hypothetical protein
MNASTAALIFSKVIPTPPQGLREPQDNRRYRTTLRLQIDQLQPVQLREKLGERLAGSASPDYRPLASGADSSGAVEQSPEGVAKEADEQLHARQI